MTSDRKPRFTRRDVLTAGVGGAATMLGGGLALAGKRVQAQGKSPCSVRRGSRRRSQRAR
ncbi:MAG: hypothetical protein R3E39_11275 [Anaerolineae bacterium]